MDIVRELSREALQRAQERPKTDYEIQGVWTTQLCFQPNQKERCFTYTYLLVQTKTGQGCAYCPAPLELPTQLTGEDAREIQAGGPLKIALLDAIHDSFKAAPARSWKIEGTSFEKTKLRTELVIWEALRLLTGQELNKARVVNVGVVGNFLSELKRMGVGELVGTDFDPALVNRDLGGVPIYSGDRTLETFYVKLKFKKDQYFILSRCNS